MSRMLPKVMLTVAAAVAAATVAEAIRQRTLAPLWGIAWLPAVVAGAFYRPAGWPCRRRT